MIRHWLTRYRLRYPRSLVYMLQASEYDIRDYLAWYHTVKDFSRVEHRKQFVGTTKGLLLLFIAWMIILLLGVAAFSVIRFGVGSSRYFLFLFTICCAPVILAYVIVIPLLAIRFFIQWPVEFFMIGGIKKCLQTHKAVKIAVAGSYGKTTMREILRTVLSEGKKAVAPPHNYNTPLGISRFVKTLTGDEEILIFEFGEYYPGDIRKLCSVVQPDMGVITGVNEAHLQKFKRLERTTKTIFELADYLGNKPVYVNGESRLARETIDLRHIAYSRERVGEWEIGNRKTDLTGTSFTLTKGNTELEFHSALLGLHQIGPLAAVAHIALHFGLSFGQVRDGIGKTRPFDHRLEPKVDDAGVTTLDDSYNGNPDGVRAVIEFLASLKGRRRFYVTPGLVEMGVRTEEVHREIGRNLAEASIEKVILIKNSVTGYIEQGLKAAGFVGDVLWFDDALSAFAALPHMTVRGDVVLLQNDWPDQYQ